MKKLVLSTIVCVGLFGAIIPNNVDKILNDNGCKSCHNIVGPNLAPAFAGIARKNLNWYGSIKAKENIIASIKNGSTQKYRRFKDAMPSFSNLNNIQLETLANWILSQKSKFNSNRGNHRNW